MCFGTVMYSLYLRVFCIHSAIFEKQNGRGGRGIFSHIIDTLVYKTFFEVVGCWEAIFSRKNFAMDNSKYYLKYYFKCNKI